MNRPLPVPHPCGTYTVDAEGVPRPEPDPEAWSAWFRLADRRVAETDLPGGVTVSTICLGVHTGREDRPPQLWETIIFGGPHDGEGRKYGSLAAARLGHDLVVHLCSAGADLGGER